MTDYKALARSFECADMTDAEFMRDVAPLLAEQYKAVEIPICPKHNKPLVVQSAGAGPTIYACDIELREIEAQVRALPEDSNQRLPLLRMRYVHYEATRRDVVSHGDPRVINLIHRLRNYMAFMAARRCPPLPPGWVAMMGSDDGATFREIGRWKQGSQPTPVDAPRYVQIVAAPTRTSVRKKRGKV